MSDRSVSTTIADLANAQSKLSDMRDIIEQQNQRAEGLSARAYAVEESYKREVTRLRDLLSGGVGALYIRLDGSTRQGGVHAGTDGPLREVREASLARAEWRIDPWSVRPTDTVPLNTRTFRLLGQVGKLYVYGEV